MKLTKVVWIALSLLLHSLNVHAGNIECAQSIAPDCGATPSAAFDAAGVLWVAFEQNQHVYVSRSLDEGASFSPAVLVNTEPESIYTNGENRPKIAFGKKGEVLLSWTKKTEGRFAGDVRFSRSLDSGKTFSIPVTVNDDGLQTSHRFDALHVTESGRVYIAWLDKRDKVRQAAQGKPYHGAALYYAVSDDAGESFSSNIRVAEHSCECCRIAIAGHGQDEVAVMWRQIYGKSTRDHALAVLGRKGPVSVARATVDDWQIDACPHHGPDIAPSVDGEGYHMVWFSNGSIHQGIYYDRFELASAGGVKPLSIDSRPGASHPQVALSGNLLYVLWKYFDGERTELLLKTSNDGGKSWAETVAILSTAGASDHPQLIQYGERLYTGWHAEREGYRVVELD